MKTLEEQLKSAKRELALRRRVFPVWIHQSRITPDKAEHEIECMAAIVQTLEKCKALEEVSEDMKKQPRLGL